MALKQLKHLPASQATAEATDAPRAGQRGAAHPSARLVIADGTLEALKWLGMTLMTLDHVNKFFFHGASAVLFDLGRMVMPLFGFVLMYNLARPDALATGVHLRVMRRLWVYGALATLPFMALVGAWPLNILFMLLLSTVLIGLIERGGRLNIVSAVMAFVVVGALVEFWWFGVLACLGAWGYCRKTTTARLMLWMLALASLWVVNRNFGALAVLPLIWAASRINIPLQRRSWSRWIFYAFYPAHLGAIWLALHMGWAHSS